MFLDVRHFVDERAWLAWHLRSLLAAIPFDWIPSNSLEGTEALAIAKLGRLFRIGRIIKKLDQFTAARFVRIFNLLILLLICTHVCPPPASLRPPRVELPRAAPGAVAASDCTGCEQQHRASG